MKALVAALIAVALAACNGTPRDGKPVVQPPRQFMHGGVWFPAATGYWFHQYVVEEELEPLLQGLGYRCSKADVDGAAGLRCERGVRVPGRLFSRTDTTEFAFRRNGAVASAHSSCRFAFFDLAELSGTCEPYAAPGAVFPDVQTFAAIVQAMLQPRPMHEPISVYRIVAGTPAPLPDAQAAIDRLARWRFECDVPRQRYSVGFRGKSGEVVDLACRHASLTTPGGPPQRQQVVVRYESVDLAVLGITVRLDDATATLTGFNTPPDAIARGASAPRATPSSLTLVTLAGERFDMPLAAVGTGSRQSTRDGFVTLTPESQRALVQAYLDKRSREWAGNIARLSYANLPALDWYGPDAVPHLVALMSDERIDVGAALIKYLCFDVPAQADSRDLARLVRAMTECVDGHRADMPRSLAEVDRLLAAEMRDYATMNARALDAYYNFRRDVLIVQALGRSGRESRAALDVAVEGKADALAPSLQQLVASARAGAGGDLQQR